MFNGEYTFMEPCKKLNECPATPKQRFSFFYLFQHTHWVFRDTDGVFGVLQIILTPKDINPKELKEW